ncbi:microtubule associated protein-domain-containing protein [Spinellus fusiger]|nr:microtubule associated protein-domain-containing protein [Spinellus fusiger]
MEKAYSKLAELQSLWVTLGTSQDAVMTDTKLMGVIQQLDKIVSQVELEKRALAADIIDILENMETSCRMMGVDLEVFLSSRLSQDVGFKFYPHCYQSIVPSYPKRDALAALNALLKKELYKRRYYLEKWLLKIDALCKRLALPNTAPPLEDFNEDINYASIQRVSCQLRDLTAIETEHKSKFKLLAYSIQFYWNTLSHVPDTTDAIEVSLKTLFRSTPINGNIELGMETFASKDIHYFKLPLPEPLSLSQNTLSLLEIKATQFKEIYDTRFKIYNKYVNGIHHLWEELKVSSNKRCLLPTTLTFSSLQKLQTDFETLDSELKKKVQKHIAKLIVKLTELWDQCLIPQKDRDIFIKNTEHNVTSLNQVEKSVSDYMLSLLALKRETGLVFSIMKQRKELIQRMVDFEKNASDPKRLFRASFQLMDEERWRKTCFPTLLQLDADLIYAVKDYEQLSGKYFIYDNHRYLDILHDEIADRSANQTFFGFMNTEPATRSDRANKGKPVWVRSSGVFGKKTTTQNLHVPFTEVHVKGSDSHYGNEELMSVVSDESQQVITKAHSDPTSPLPSRVLKTDDVISSFSPSSKSTNVDPTLEASPQPHHSRIRSFQKVLYKVSFSPPESKTKPCSQLLPVNKSSSHGEGNEGVSGSPPYCDSRKNTGVIEPREDFNEIYGVSTKHSLLQSSLASMLSNASLFESNETRAQNEYSESNSLPESDPLPGIPIPRHKQAAIPDSAFPVLASINTEREKTIKGKMIGIVPLSMTQDQVAKRMNAMKPSNHHIQTLPSLSPPKLRPLAPTQVNILATSKHMTDYENSRIPTPLHLSIHQGKANSSTKEDERKKQTTLKKVSSKGYSIPRGSKSCYGQDNFKLNQNSTEQWPEYPTTPSPIKLSEKSDEFFKESSTYSFQSPKMKRGSKPLPVTYNRTVKHSSPTSPTSPLSTKRNRQIPSPSSVQVKTRAQSVSREFSLELSRAYTYNLGQEHPDSSHRDFHENTKVGSPNPLQPSTSISSQDSPFSSSSSEGELSPNQSKRNTHHSFGSMSRIPKSTCEYV